MNTIKIIVVDDHQLILDGLKFLINDVPEFNFVGEARSGLEALELVKSTPCDIILMDIEMDGISGIETTQLLIKENPEAKILALTMYNEKGIIDKFMEAGASGYALKNITPEELTEAIKTVISGKKYFSKAVTDTLMEKKSTKIVSSKVDPLDDLLTRREIEILKLIAQGFSNREVGEKLGISPRTVDTHRTNVMEKLEIKNIAALIRYAIENGYLD
jgi:DNA-binding NarL/FixJ family response regulator